MLQIIIDHFLIKNEYHQIQEDNDEQDFINEIFKYDSEDSTVCNYISNKGEDDNDAEDIKDDRDVKDNEIISKANYLHPYCI